MDNLSSAKDTGVAVGVALDEEVMREEDVSLDVLMSLCREGRDLKKLMICIFILETQHHKSINCDRSCLESIISLFSKLSLDELVNALTVGFQKAILHFLEFANLPPNLVLMVAHISLAYPCHGKRRVDLLEQH
ncbi:hypothetical protein Tco_0990597 [Tanacetum coccineum]|uniref:Uncharacterized protein n=1 Tax=Tanacetum coccineum TaxID=301880 RepID=A0ABQ5EWY0_9ASTR